MTWVMMDWNYGILPYEYILNISLLILKYKIYVYVTSELRSAWELVIINCNDYAISLTEIIYK